MTQGFPGGSEGEASACNVGDLGSIPGSGRSPGEGNGTPLPVFLPGESHGQRSLVGHSPQGRKQKLKESRMDEKEWLFSTKDDKWMTRTNLRLKLQIDS